MIKSALKWLWSHFGWGWHGHSIDKVSRQRRNPDRQALKAYCKEFGLTRKAAKKGLRRAKMYRINWANVRRALYDRWKARK